MDGKLSDLAESLLHSMISGHVVNEFEAANVARAAWKLAEAFQAEGEKREKASKDY